LTAGALDADNSFSGAQPPTKGGLRTTAIQNLVERQPHPAEGGWWAALNKPTHIIPTLSAAECCPLKRADALADAP